MASIKIALWISSTLYHSHLMDHVPADTGCREDSPALPEALQEAPVIAVVGHAFRGKEVKLDNLDAPGPEHGLIREV